MHVDDKAQLMKDWARRQLTSWLDPEYQLSVMALERKGWAALPVADFINPMEAEWLADAMRLERVGEAVGIAFEHGGEPSVDRVPLTRDGIVHFNGNNSCRYVLLMPENDSCLYYKDEANRYYLLCGSKAFISRAYKCSLDTATLMYKEWTSLEQLSTDEKRYLLQVWQKYSQLRGSNDSQ
jgi:hypothetical protein